ncbi:hypothetical protein [Chitinimonas sp.]|uniref:hypothetical protein n=1 Tax=Chitinimonas sp. TaxID=1934313 RepID=UPI0035B14F1F
MKGGTAIGACRAFVLMVSMGAIAPMVFLVLVAFLSGGYVLLLFVFFPRMLAVLYPFLLGTNGHTWQPVFAPMPGMFLTVLMWSLIGGAFSYLARHCTWRRAVGMAFPMLAVCWGATYVLVMALDIFGPAIRT